jgi:hypothetical protein
MGSADLAIAGAALAGGKAPANVVMAESEAAVVVTTTTTAKFSRSAYGSKPTKNPVAESIRQAGDGQPCPSCEVIMRRNGPQATRPSAPHNPSLKRHYETVGKKMTREERKAYTRSKEAYEPKAKCVSCNSREGAN